HQGVGSLHRRPRHFRGTVLEMRLLRRPHDLRDRDRQDQPERLVQSVSRDASELCATPMTDTFDELRIIAKDGGRLSTTDRDVIRRAADELQQVSRLLVSTQAALIEAQQRQIATNERLLQANADVVRLKTEAKPRISSYDPAKWVTQQFGSLK